MNKLYYIVILTLLLSSCNEERGNQKVRLVSNKIELTDKLKSVLTQFINENPCKDCINKVYIDKVYNIESIDHKTIITIQQIPFNKADYIKLKPIPLLSLDVGTSTFFVFSGLEDYFTISTNKPDSTNNRLSNKYVIWTILDTKDSLIIRKSGMHPFSAFPLPEAVSIDSTKKK